jgi:hypothetical protein
MAEKVRRHSRIGDELPAELRREVDRLLVEGNVTYDDIQAFLAEKGHDISRSAIGRYGKEFLARYQRLRIVEDQSRTLVSEAGEGMILEEAAAKLFAQKIVEAQLSGELDIMELPRLVSDFAKLQSSTVARERFKRDMAKKAEKAIDTIEKKAKTLDIPAELLDVVKREIYGIL